VSLSYENKNEQSARTPRISVSVIAPPISCLFANTRRDAPARRYKMVRLICVWTRMGHDWDEARAPPLSTTHAVLSCNLPCASDRLSQQPTRAHLFAQSSCANTVVACADRRRPLYKFTDKYGTLGVRGQPTYVQGIPNRRWRIFRYAATWRREMVRTHFP
jgi:hypothetical protein